MRAFQPSDQHMQRSCGRAESGMFEELKESQCGWRVVNEGKQVQITLHQVLGELLKIVPFVPRWKGWKQGSNSSSLQKLPLAAVWRVKQIPPW